MNFKRAHERAIADVEAIRAVLRRLSEPYEPPTARDGGKPIPYAGPKLTVLEELIRRGEHSAKVDGAPASAGGSERHGSGEYAEPTLAAVLARDEAEKRDLIGDALGELLRSLDEAVDVMRQVDRVRHFVFAIQGKPYGRENTIEKCTRCDDPIVAEPIDGKPSVRRIDGKPYHANTCFQRERRRRGEAGVAWSDDLDLIGGAFLAGILGSWPATQSCGTDLSA